MLDQEQRIIGFAREGKGTFRPLAPGRTDGLDGLSDEQKAAVRHVWNSTDRVMLIRGGAGTGKTTMMKPGAGPPRRPGRAAGPLLRRVARQAAGGWAFKDANTVAAFLGQQGHAGTRPKTASSGSMRPGCWPIDDLEQLCGLAKSLNARVVLQGDPAQHKAVQRHGNMLEVLEDYAGLPVAETHQNPAAEGRVCPGRGGDPRRASMRKASIPCCASSAGSSRARGMTSWSSEYASAIEERKAERRAEDRARRRSDAQGRRCADAKSCARSGRTRG